MKGFALFANSLTFTGVPLALSYKARFGGPMKRLAFLAHRPAFTGLRHSRANSKRGNHSSKNNTLHSSLPFLRHSQLDIHVHWDQFISKASKGASAWDTG